MLIKLLEIYEEIIHVEKAESYKKLYFIREIVINTNFIVTMKSDISIEKRLQENPNNFDGLDKNEKFTRISLNKGSSSNDVVVIGSLDQIIKMMDLNNKKVIKG